MDTRIVSICERAIRLAFAALFLFTPLLVCPWTYELFEFPKMMFVYGVTIVVTAAFLIKTRVTHAVAIFPVAATHASPSVGAGHAPQLQHFRDFLRNSCKKSLFGILNTRYQILDAIQRRDSNPLVLPIILYLLSFILSTSFSTHPHTSIFGYYSRFHGGLLSLICYVSLFFIYIAESRRPALALAAPSASGGPAGNDPLFDNPPAVRYLLTAAFIVSLYGILQHFGIDRDYWIQDSSARVFSTLGQPNWLAAWLLMILPLSWVFYFSSKSCLLDTYYLLLSTILFASFWFTYSLSGLLGFIVAAVIFVILTPKRTFLGNKNHGLTPEVFVPLRAPAALHSTASSAALRPRFSLSWNKKKIFLLTTCYLLLVISGPGLFAPRIRRVWESLTVISAPPRRGKPFGLGILNPKGWGIGVVRAAETAPAISGGDTVQIRKIVWRGALNLWKSSPKNMLIGTGPETFAYNFLSFRPAELNQTSEWEFLYNKSHNEYLDILCNTGILGLGSYLFLVGSFLGWGIRKLKAQNSKLKTTTQSSKPFPLILNTKYLILNTRYLLPALLSGYIGLLITNFFGFSVVPTALLFWLYPAICFSLCL